MEDMTGWRMNDVKTYTELLGIKMENMKELKSPPPPRRPLGSRI